MCSDCVHQLVALKIYSPCRGKKDEFIFHFGFCFWLSFVIYVSAFKGLLNLWRPPLRMTLNDDVLELDLAEYLFLWLPTFMKQSMTNAW